MLVKTSAFTGGRNRRPAALSADSTSAVSSSFNIAQAEAVWELLAECCGFDVFVGGEGDRRSAFVARMTDEHLPLQWRTWRFTSADGYEASFSLSQMLISNCSNEPSQSWISRLMRANYALRRLMLVPVVAS
ncbi:TPA: hypothetical protein ACYLN4_000567 [Burkholderia lata]